MTVGHQKGRGAVSNTRSARFDELSTLVDGEWLDHCIYLGAAAREGFDNVEKLALQQVRGGLNSRVGTHAYYEKLRPHIQAAADNEDFGDTVARLRWAAELDDLL